MKISKKVLVVTVSSAALVAIIVWALIRTPFDEQRPAVGAKAPQLHLADVSGRMVNLDDHLGSVVIINFWAEWCPPCKDELGWFESVYADYRDRGVEIVAISTEDLSVEDAMSLSMSYPVAVANERVIEAYGDVSGVPQTFLVGRDGRIIRKVRRAWPEKDIREALDSLLKEN